MHASQSSMPSSMLTSMMLAPPRTWSSATSTAPAQSLVLDQPRELLRAGDVGALADHQEVAVGPERQRLEAATAREREARRAVPARLARAGRPREGESRRPPGDRPNVIRRRAAAAADDVDEAALGEFLDQRAPSRPAVSSYWPNAFGRPALG